MSKKSSVVVDLAALAPKKTFCDISVGRVEVGKVGVGDIAAILAKYPAIASVFNGASGAIDMTEIAGAAPGAIPEFIAYATPGKLDSLDGVMSLDAGDQFRLFSAAFKNSFPRGVHDFFSAFAEDLPSLVESATKGLTEEDIAKDLLAQ